MVKITIFIEGGVLQNDNISAITMDNSEKLREGFYLLLTQIISPQYFKIIVKQGSSNQQTISFFKANIDKSKNTVLLIDLDYPKEQKAQRIKDLKLKEYSDNVFFMVQEMEAWIISQIDKIDIYFKDKYKRKKNGVALSDHYKIKDKNPEDIVKPSKVLKKILGQYFRDNQNKKKKYGKLKDGAIFISLLNATELQKIFEDFNNLTNTIKAFSKV